MQTSADRGDVAAVAATLPEFEATMTASLRQLMALNAHNQIDMASRPAAAL